MWFAPVSQARGSETLKQMALTKQILAKYGLDPAIYRRNARIITFRRTVRQN